jgi:choline monooxygenase
VIADVPHDLIGVPLDRARTLPGRWYSDAAHHEIELDVVFGRQWVNVGSADDVASPGSYLASTAGRLPVLVVRDDAGTLRAFLNVCRHRGAPLASGCGHARALSCPYHAWLYRLDGSLSRAGGVGEPVGFDRADFGLREIKVATFARSVVVNVDPSAPPFDPGPLGAGLEPYRLDELEIGERTRYECRFNWKVLLENYCENYHTPFIHSQLPVAGYEYPIECAGNVVFAWDRPLEPRDRAERALHDHRPGTAGWSAVAEVAAEESFNNGSYLALFPNTAVSCFAGFAATFRLIPTSPSTTVVEREYLWHRSVPPERRAADFAATREVVEQDLAICQALQGTYDAGLSANGVLSTEHESGVAHIHQLLLAALSGAR